MEELCSSSIQWPLMTCFVSRVIGKSLFFIDIICWVPWISQVQSTGLPSVFLRGDP